MYNHVVPQNNNYYRVHVYTETYSDRNGKLKKLHLIVHKNLHSFRARARATSIYTVHVLLLCTQYLLSSPSALRWCLDGNLLISEINKKRSFV